MRTDLTALPPLLKALEETAPTDHGMLSVYLDTGPDRLDGPAYLFAFRDGCKALRQAIATSERDALETAVGRGERYLLEEFTPSAPGLALFVPGDGSEPRAVALPVAPDDEVSWEARPQLTPLYALLHQYERIAAVLLDTERARLFTIHLGAIEAQQEVRDVVPGKQATGGWFALAQTRYARRHEKYELQHVQRTIAALLAMLHTYPFDRLLLGGPDEAVALLKHHLPPSLRDRLAGTLDLELFAAESEVLQAALAAEEVLTRRADLEVVEELITNAGAPYVVLGLDETLAVVSEKRSHHLIVAETLEAEGRECTQCVRLFSAGERCPICATALSRVPDLGARLIEYARAQGMAVTVVSGPASKRLLEYGGVGAWLYY